jgi:hypothetical protein
VRVSATTNRDVKGGSWSARVSQSLAKPDLFNEPFRGVNILDPVFRITSPQAIAMNLNLFRKFGKHAAILSK